MEQTSTIEGDASTQQRILAATAEVLGRNGKRKLSLSDVAVQAGVSRPTLYRWFASRRSCSRRSPITSGSPSKAA